MSLRRMGYGLILLVLGEHFFFFEVNVLVLRRMADGSG